MTAPLPDLSTQFMSQGWKPMQAVMLQWAIPTPSICESVLEEKGIEVTAENVERLRSDFLSNAQAILEGFKP